ncbi:hypothetical protein EWM60_05580 [Candidatus Erwinia dacicola]|nr:hypothetical protein [Candidatus Erwinia dacicola]
MALTILPNLHHVLRLYPPSCQIYTTSQGSTQKAVHIHMNNFTHNPPTVLDKYTVNFAEFNAANKRRSTLNCGFLSFTILLKK